MHRKPSLDICGAKDLDPQRPDNPPGRSEVDYRIGTQPEFLDRMLWRVPRQEVPARDGVPASHPLRGLRPDRAGEPTGGLLDAFACTLDVLSFYSERIANEGYLASARERRSMIELAATIGYKLGPGVASGTWLAFTVEDKDDPFRRVEIAPGVQAASVPQAKDELPQTFETLEPIVARGEWNDIRARTTRDQPLAIYRNLADEDDPANGTLFLFDLDNSFDTDDPALAGLVELASDAALEPYHAVTPGLDLSERLAQRIADRATNPEIEPLLRAVPVNEVFVHGLGLALRPGQRLLAVARSGSEGATIAEPYRIVTVTEKRDFGITTLILARHGNPPDAVSTPPRFRPARLKPGIIPAQGLSLASSTLDRYVKGNAWTGDGLSAFVRTQSWSRTKLMAMLRGRLRPVVGPAGVGEVQTGLHAMSEDAGFFGNSAQLWATVSFGRNADGTAIKAPFSHDWDSTPTTIWVDAKNSLLQGEAQAYLEREVKAVQPGSWAILENAAGESLGLQVTAAATQSRADYAMSGKATGLAFALPDGTPLVPPASAVSSPLNAFKVRKTQAFLASQHLPLAGIPLEPVLEAEVLELDLDTLYLDLVRGRPVSVTGARADAEGIEGSETCIIREVLHIDGVTRLLLEGAIIHSYERTSLRINANVALASHGERVTEVLGSGDATLPNQSFGLRKIPLTYVSATTASGRASTLEVRVDGILWREVETLFDAGPQDAVYETALGESSEVTVRFGDGIKGRRLPTGELNVAASYRSGTGLAGHVPERTIIQLKTKPLGIRSVSNPSPATGGAEPESLDDIRVTAPNTVKTLGRVVSLADYEDFARNFAGVGKARAEQLWSGRNKVVHISLAPEEDIELAGDADLLSKLADALEGVRDPARAVIVQPYARVYFRVKAKVYVDRAYLLADLERDVRLAIETRYSFASGALGEAVSSAGILALIHSLPGVTMVDLDGLERIEGGDLVDSSVPPRLDSVLRAASAQGPGQRMTGSFAASELLLVLPSAIDLTMEFADA
ncbi:putative baseplate assembly protein [Parerythrobacter lacustris]|uniref:Baseplate assembly protein n=1 Tax=Parerythrobacter lacustris TaxID=2969984 RepID=A0ABT1XUE2_9SPHN|nr:putative baseplate assembly protein [Parerythrobacter lacustris]